VVKTAKQLVECGFKLIATAGTAEYLNAQGIKVESILKLHEGRPNIVDAIKNGSIQLIVNTPSGKLSAHDDSYIRKSAIKHNIPYITTVAAAYAAAKGIAARQTGELHVMSLQELHARLV